MTKQVPQIETGWHVFGQTVGIVGGVALSIFVIYLLLVAPYERHKEIIQKLDQLYLATQQGHDIILQYERK